MPATWGSTQFDDVGTVRGQELRGAVAMDVAERLKRFGINKNVPYSMKEDSEPRERKSRGLESRGLESRGLESRGYESGGYESGDVGTGSQKDDMRLELRGLDIYSRLESA